MVDGLQTWLMSCQAVIANDLPRLGAVAGLYVVFTLFEVGFPAERGQGATGRVRNIVFAVIYVLGGGLLVGTILLLLPCTGNCMPIPN